MNKALMSSLVAVAMAVFSAQSSASHHFETDLSKAFPAFDLTDLYVFDSATPATTVFIIDSNPKTRDDGSVGFGEDGLYNLHIAADRRLDSGMTFTFRYSNRNLVVGKLAGSNPALGVEGEQIGMVPIGEATRLANGIRVWAGAAKDPFVGNAAGIGKFRDALRAGKYDASTFDAGGDAFATLFTSAIVVEVPNEMLPGAIEVYASTAIKLDGQWMQVNRLANVLLTHLFLLGDPTVSVDHAKHRPDDDGQRQLWLSAAVARAATLAGTQDHPVAYGDRIAARLLPDLMPYQVGSKARYGVDRFNGRRPTDDAMDVALSLFAGVPMTDKANTFDRHPQVFPYLVPVRDSGDAKPPSGEPPAANRTGHRHAPANHIQHSGEAS